MSGLDPGSSEQCSDSSVPASLTLPSSTPLPVPEFSEPFGSGFSLRIILAPAGNCVATPFLSGCSADH